MPEVLDSDLRDLHPGLRCLESAASFYKSGLNFGGKGQPELDSEFVIEGLCQIPAP